MANAELGYKEWERHITHPPRKATCQCGASFKPSWNGKKWSERCLDCQWEVKVLRDHEVEDFMMSCGTVFSKGARRTTRHESQD